RGLRGYPAGRAGRGHPGGGRAAGRVADPAGGHRDGPVGRRRAGLRFGRGRAVRARAAARGGRPGGHRGGDRGGRADPHPAGPAARLQVDANLRPEGRSGPLVRSLASYAMYYERWADVWEAQALLRAVPVAGDAGVGERFVTLVDRLRYPPSGLPAAAVTEIRRIKARVDAERLPRGADPATHTKLGRGGRRAAAATGA